MHRPPAVDAQNPDWHVPPKVAQEFGIRTGYTRPHPPGEFLCKQGKDVLPSWPLAPWTTSP